MGLFTPLPVEDAKPLLVEYGIDLASVEPLAAGSVNSNFRLRARDGTRYFARIYEEQGEPGARAELRMLSELSKEGIPVVAALAPRRLPSATASGAPGAFGVRTVAGKPFAVYPWVDGEILCQARVAPEHARRVGEALARLHLASSALSAVPEGRFRVEDLEARLDRIDAEAPEYADATAHIRERLAAHVARRFPLPSGIVHGDLFRDNVLWQGGRIAALLDFESASRGAFAFDLAVALLAWCYGDTFDASLLRAMLGGYHAVRTLSEAEQEGLAAEAAIAALRFATTRITDFSMRTPPGQPPARSYARFLDRLRAVEAGALDAGLAGLG